MYFSAKGPENEKSRLPFVIVLKGKKGRASMKEFLKTSIKCSIASMGCPIIIKDDWELRGYVAKWIL
jgi:hypothetical protein